MYEQSNRLEKSNTPEEPLSQVWESIAFIAVLIIIGLNAFLAYKTVDSIARHHRSVTDTGNIIVSLKDLRHAVLSAESGQRGYLLTSDEIYLRPYHAALKVLETRVRAVSNIETEIPKQKERIEKLLALIDEKIGELEKTVAFASNDRDQLALQLVQTGQGFEIQQRLTQLFNTIEAQEFMLQAQSYKKLAKAERDSEILFFTFLVISAALLLGVFVVQRKRTRAAFIHRRELESRAEELEQKVTRRTQELTLYSEELSRSNRELEDFAFVASHDLQEPLRKVRAFSSRIKKLYEDALDEKGVNYLNRMDKAAERMSALIQDLLAFSRIKTRGKEFVPVNLGEVVALVMEDLEYAIEDTQAKISLDELPTVDADGSQMSQLFLNLLSNAIKFRQEDAVPEVHIRYQKVEKDVDGVMLEYHEITVKDSGIGFEQEYGDKIFLPFQRLHSREEYDGTGIGLALCRRIVERHGGSIDVSSSLGNGAEFTVSLPVMMVDLAQV